MGQAGLAAQRLLPGAGAVGEGADGGDLALDGGPVGVVGERREFDEEGREVARQQEGLASGDVQVLDLVGAQDGFAVVGEGAAAAGRTNAPVPPC